MIGLHPPHTQKNLDEIADGVQSIIDNLLDELKSARDIRVLETQQSAIYHKVANSALKIPGLQLSSLPKPDEFLLNPLGHIDRIFELLASVSARGATLRTDMGKLPNRHHKLEVELNSDCSVPLSNKEQSMNLHQGMSQATFGNHPRQIRVSNTSVSSNSSQIHLAHLVSCSPTNQSAMSHQNRQTEVSSLERARCANGSEDRPQSFHQGSSTADSTTRQQIQGGSQGHTMTGKVRPRDHRLLAAPTSAVTRTGETKETIHRQQHSEQTRMRVGYEDPAFYVPCPEKSTSSSCWLPHAQSKVVSSLQHQGPNNLMAEQIKAKSMEEYWRNDYNGSDDYEFRFSKDLPEMNANMRKKSSIILRDSTSCSTPAISKENMLSGYQSSEELSDSAEYNHNNSKDTEDLLQSYHSVYTESDRPQPLKETFPQQKADSSYDAHYQTVNVRDLDVVLPTTSQNEPTKTVLSDVSMRLIQEVDSRILAESDWNSFKKDAVRERTSPKSSYSKYFKVKKTCVARDTWDDAKENVGCGNRVDLRESGCGGGQGVAKLQIPTQLSIWQARELQQSPYGGQFDGIDNNYSEIQVDENGQLYGITCRSNATQQQNCLTSGDILVSTPPKTKHRVAGKENTFTPQKEPSKFRPLQQPKGQVVSSTLKNSIMSSQYNMMLSAEMLKREHLKHHGPEESSKWSVEQNFPATGDTTGSRGRKNSAALPSSMPSSGKETAPGVISTDVEGWVSQDRCRSTGAGRQPSPSKQKSKKVGATGSVCTNTATATAGYYNSYRRNFRPFVSGTSANTSVISSQSRDLKEKSTNKGNQNSKSKLWK